MVIPGLYASFAPLWYVPVYHGFPGGWGYWSYEPPPGDDSITRLSGLVEWLAIIAVTLEVAVLAAIAVRFAGA